MRLLDATGRRLEALVARVQADGRFPSVAAGVVRDGELVWSTGRGRHVHADGDERADADTQYKVGSVTKTMTAALVLRVAETGQLDLADPVGRFVPEGPFAETSLRSLLAHASGMSAEPLGSWWERSPGVDYATLARQHQNVSRVLPPGEQFHYSNLGYAILGEVVARIHGAPWWDVLLAELLVPLGMKRTSYQGETPCADGFSVDALTGELFVEPLPDTGAMAPAGQLWSTVADMGSWLTALVDPDRGVLSEAGLRAMRTPQSGSPDDPEGGTYGLGLSISTDGDRVLIGHGGSMPGFICGVQIEPESGVGAVMLTNGSYGLSHVTADMIELVLEHEPALPPEWAPTASVPDDVRDIVGSWYWGNAPSVLRVDDDEIALESQGIGRMLRFGRVDTDTFVGTAGYHTGETLRAIRRGDGSVSHLEVATFIYTRTPYDPAAPIPGAGPEPG